MSRAGLRVAEPPATWLASGDLVDLNVWIALLGRHHIHHAAARRYWDACAPIRAKGLAHFFCRSTMLGLLRMLCQPALMGEAVLKPPQAHALYRSLRTTPGVGFQVDHETADALLDQWLAGDLASLPAKHLTDAWLAAVAETSGRRLVTFDNDFKRFPLTRLLLLDAA
ncbi:TA system VapC family ribonuclease toxin [Pelomonas sp. KK5]|uniref:TA system VapC family ribonuclease toxin n=1 Tax=Pelomonas sp. KK5 TaxID=1855730 RepID=UPI00097C8B30|nr:TA system VapC family ribonuclease toxin [Pelomonas sp. KK5]